ncbi:ATP-binding protein [Embleya sp. AB8]|uniref:ATP-binding protein n=1 Tax=Embleya sp. AB8 TaxID=3156304 RepID=UPI003C779B7A
MPSDASACSASAINAQSTACFWVVTSDAIPVKRARERALRLCAEWRVNGDGLALVLTELLTNAFEHGRLKATDRVVVRICRRLREIELVVVVPQAAYRIPEPAEDLNAEDGRGLTIVHALTREFACIERFPGYQTLIAVLGIT